MNTVLAKDIMAKDILTVGPEMSAKELADALKKRNVGGAPVVDGNGKLIGVVTESDLIVHGARIHYPTYIHLLDGYIYMPSSLAKFNEEFKKALGSTVGEIMSEDVVTAGPEATVEDLATLMTDNEVGRIPIVDAGRKVIGIVTKHDLISAISSAG